MRNTILVIVILLVLGGLLFYFKGMSANPANTTGSAQKTPIADVTYSCDKNRTIHALYYEGAPAPAPQEGQPPTPTGSVVVSFDGGASVRLAQTLSADGARYSDGNPQIQAGEPGAEKLVFWNKGDSALIMRDNAMDQTYTNCTAPKTP